MNKITCIKKAIVIGITSCILIGCGKSEPAIDGVVDIFDYVSVDFDGANGQGSIGRECECSSV